MNNGFKCYSATSITNSTLWRADQALIFYLLIFHNRYLFSVFVLDLLMLAPSIGRFLQFEIFINLKLPNLANNFKVVRSKWSHHEVCNSSSECVIICLEIWKNNHSEFLSVGMMVQKTLKTITAFWHFFNKSILNFRIANGGVFSFKPASQIRKNESTTCETVWVKQKGFSSVMKFAN